MTSTSLSSSSSSKRVAYFYDAEYGNYHYGQGHPMKPHRVRMTHNLVVNYGLYRHMDVLRPEKLSSTQPLTRFHSHDYITCLQSVTPDNLQDSPQTLKRLQRFNLGEDCPIFDGLWEFCELVASASLGAAQRLNSGKADVCIHWGGGFHHPKRAEAAGFGYVNDCVLAILELLQTHNRVLYIDLGIHHADGVEEAFYTTSRVLTCSFHKYGDFYPGTGDREDWGHKEGKYYAVNVPLLEGINDESFLKIFRPIVDNIITRYQPSAVVLQCGADSLSGDRLGCFNLSVKGHGACVAYVQKYNLPLLLLGGGGFNLRQVPRCWTYETALVLGEHATLKDELPFNEYYDYFGPDYRLHLPVSNMENLNTKEYLQQTKRRVLDQLQRIEAKPSAGIHTGQIESSSSSHKRHRGETSSIHTKEDRREHAAELAS